MPFPEVLKWPEQLNHVMARLEPDMDQEFHKFRTDSGDVISRATASPCRVYRGTASLSEADYSVLKAFANICLQGRHHFSFAHPHTEEATYGVFNAVPFLRRQRMSFGFEGRSTGPSHSVYEMEIVIRDTTVQVKEALQMGILRCS